MLVPSFYTALGASYAIALILMTSVNLVTRRLDIKFKWRQKPLSRTLLQVCFGLILPLILAFSLANVYLLAMSIPILDTNYLKMEFPLIVLLLVVMNLYYLVYYFWHKDMPNVQQLSRQDNFSMRFLSDAPNIHESVKAKEVFLASTFDRTVPIALEDIACVFIQGEHYILQTFRRETHVIEQTLNEVEELNKRQFFRINRQCIVNYRLCKGFRPVDNGRLELELGPPVDGTRFVSRDKAQEFRQWMER